MQLLQDLKEGQEELDVILLGAVVRTQSEHVKELFAKFQGDAPTKMMSKRTGQKMSGLPRSHISVKNGIKHRKLLASMKTPVFCRNQLHLDSGYKAQKPRARGEPKGADDAREIDIDLGFLQEVDSLGVSLQEHSVERAKPGRVRVCVLPGSAQSKPPPPPSSTKPPPVAPLVAPPADPKSRRKVSAVAPAIEKLVDPKADSGPGVVLEPEPQSSSVPQLGALRQEGAMIVLNCEDGLCAIRFYEELGFWPQPVCHQATMHRHPPPAELRPKLVQCPVMDDDGRQEGRGSDRIFVVNLAKTYACPFVDNSNYREQVWSGHEIWPWLQKGGLAQKVEYIFDSFGEFLPSREVAPQPRGQSSSGRLRTDLSGGAAGRAESAKSAILALALS
eukprot:g28905.t1